VVGVLSGFVVDNDSTLDCLETDNQLAELEPSSVPGATTPQLVVWQLPDDQQYYYIVTTAASTDSDPGDCVNATLAIPVPAQTSTTPGMDSDPP
jgi:hypothetical protein